MQARLFLLLILFFLTTSFFWDGEEKQLNIPLQNEEGAFLHALEDSLNTHYDGLLAKAKRFLMAGSYRQALSMYEDILSAIERGDYPKVKANNTLVVKKIRYRLAECHFLAADYEKSLSFCSQEEPNSELDREILYLSARCFAEKKEYEKALELFKQYTRSGEACDLVHYDHALLEIGLHYYHNGLKAKARRYFERLQQFPGKSGVVAALYLARMLLDEGKSKEVEQRLSQVVHTLEKTDPLRYECFYLRGLAAYALHDYAASKDFFERSLDEKEGIWRSSSIYHLGWCYLRLGDDPLKAEQVRLRFFKSAEESFGKLEKNEATCLSLAQLHLLKARHFNTNEPLDELAVVLSQKLCAFSLEGQVEALLMRAEAVEGYEQKEWLYKEATQDQFRECPRFAQAWYCRGMNHFQAGLTHPLRGAPFFELATVAFEKAFRGVEKLDQLQAAHILKLKAKAHIFRNSPITSLALIEKLLVQFDESVEEREETLYLRGLLASHLTDLSYFPIAEESLTLVINGYPKGIYREGALYALGSLYYGNENYEKAKTTFAKLGNEHSDSHYAGEAWFWAAEAASRLGDNPYAYRSQMYENYPHHELAPEAYFRQFPSSAYSEGSSEALAHLRGFVGRFPQSPLHIVVNSLIALHEDQPEQQRAAFERALAAFSLHHQDTPSLQAAHVYFNYQAVLGLAELHLNSERQSDWEECERLLTTTVTDFSQKKHPFISLLTHNSPYPPQFEESEFKLVQCYLKGNKDFKAQKLLTQMLSHYSNAGIQEGRLLPRVWQELGKLALKCIDYETALTCFSLSEESGNRSFTDEQKLTLWLLQSEAFRGKKEYDTAMRLLSRVINAETASPLRLKAMYLRAEIYELEGRPELAIRQLEATAKKGGEWAQKAHEKLRRER